MKKYIKYGLSLALLTPVFPTGVGANEAPQAAQAPLTKEGLADEKEKLKDKHAKEKDALKAQKQQQKDKQKEEKKELQKKKKEFTKQEKERKKQEKIKKLQEKKEQKGNVPAGQQKSPEKRDQGENVH